VVIRIEQNTRIVVVVVVLIDANQQICLKLAPCRMKSITTTITTTTTKNLTHLQAFRAFKQSRARAQHLPQPGA
jgi:hypothetical protein